MRKITLLSSKYAFAICLSFAFAAPLYASGQPGKTADQPIPAEARGKPTLVTSQVKAAAPMTKQNTVMKKKLVKKEKIQVKMASIGFNELKERLRSTDAIGFFTKLAIRNDIVDLMDKIKKYRKSSLLKSKMKEIRSSFDGLLLKIIALLRDDPKLSRDLYVGRKSIWESLLEVKS